MSEQVVYPGFQYTGPLRPYKQSPKRTVPKHIPRPDYADHEMGTCPPLLHPLCCA